MADNLSGSVAAMLERALTYHRQGQLADARTLYDAILKSEPRHFDALNLRGTLALQTGDFENAVTLIRSALSINAHFAGAYNNLGNALLALKRLDEALAAYDKAAALTPQQAEAHYNRANALRDLQRYDEALAGYDRALALNPNYPEALNNRGSILLSLRRLEEALGSFERARALKPEYADAYNNCGNVLVELNRPLDALASYDRALAINPQQAAVHFNRANVLTSLKRQEEALADFGKAIALRPDYADAFNNRGNVLLDLRHLDAAFASFSKAVALRPTFAEAYSNLGVVLLERKQLHEALANYDKAIALKPDQAEVHYNRGYALEGLKRIDEAADSYARALGLKPNYEFLAGTLLHTQTRLCDWTDFPAKLEKLTTDLHAGTPASSPFPLLALTDDPALHKQAATAYSRTKYPARDVLGPLAKRGPGDRIRIGYYSADLREHAMAYLLAELFEAHDRARFEIFGFSIGPDTGDAMRQRISAAFDTFNDVRECNDRGVAALSRELGIDIAVDLNAYTQDSRPGMFAHRCAPVQVNFLSYPGTMGADYIDYIVADKTVIPSERHGDFTEKVITMPHCYQVNDSKRRISDRVFTRTALGLPAQGFVFCCFNNNHKILPATFEIWMRVLKAVEGSVLWLLEDNATAARNLRKEAAARGVDPQRLVFAGRMSLADHLARHRLADLFLDTLPYNAHTTASDALWAGLPVLTCTGIAFASCVAASLLMTLGLPELITDSPEAYEAKALALARDRAALQEIKERLAERRQTTPLFNGTLYARHLEDAYSAIHERSRNGLPPAALIVGPDNAAAPDNLASAVNTEAAFNLEQGNALFQQRRLEEALAAYDLALTLQPDLLDAHFNRASAAAQLKRPDEALAGFDRAIALAPDQAETHYKRGNVLVALRRFKEALASFERTLALNPDHPKAHLSRAQALQLLGRFDEALAIYDGLLGTHPERADLHNHRGNLLLARQRPEQALASYDKAIALAPTVADYHNNRGTALLDLGRAGDAIASYDRAIALNPDQAAAYINRGNAYFAATLMDKALADYDHALALDPNSPEAQVNRGHALIRDNRLSEAAVAYERALALKPDYDFLLGTVAHTRMKLCDWTHSAANVTAVTSGIAASRKVIEPFALLSLIDDPQLQRTATEIYAAARFPRASDFAPPALRPAQGKIRIGYYSSDFRSHPVAAFAAALIEAHDRSRFEVIGLSFGPDAQDDMRLRISSACDQFIRVNDRSDRDVAALSRDLGIDVAVDLNGHTQHARTGMFVARCAPVQITYLGYAGTMGLPGSIDYIVADATTLPADAESAMAEKIIRLPGSFLINGAHFTIAADAPSRAELGLPKNAFVFCGFNNAYKIVPEVFDIWMRLLKAVDGSVLWLRKDNKVTERNLRREAAARGVDPARIVFAKRMPLDQHLARQRHADLFIDTLPYNAHSTASDALRVGLPVLTCAGRSFASRVAASLLTTIGLPELVTDTATAYEARAIELARDPAKLAAIKSKLDANRQDSWLFDAQRLARHLEAAYATAHDRAQAGLPPASFDALSL